MKNKRLILQAGGLALILLVILAAVFIIKAQPGPAPGGDAQYGGTEEQASTAPTEPETEESSATALPSEAETETPSEIATQPQDEPEPEQPEPEQPEALLSILRSADLDIDELNCGQLITVQSQGTGAYISFYQKNVNGLWENIGPDAYGYVGSNGAAVKAYEGDRVTPVGLYRIGSAFYTGSAPQTGLDTFGITADTYWVDDPNSRFYNQRVEGTGEMDWSSAEHMIEYSNYRYGFVIEYNTQNIVPGIGSAIFFHCGSNPTAGCIAASEDTVLSYLSKLDAALSPYILIQ